MAVIETLRFGQFDLASLFLRPASDEKLGGVGSGGVEGARKRHGFEFHGKHLRSKKERKKKQTVEMARGSDAHRRESGGHDTFIGRAYSIYIHLD